MTSSTALPLESGSSPSIYSGIDWLSCSAPLSDAQPNLYAAGERLMRSEESLGNYRKAWTRNGLAGHVCGRVVRARNAELAFVQVSSDLAHTAFRDLLVTASNVSRIDLQITAEYPSGAAPDFATRAYHAHTPPGTPGKPPRRSLVRDTAGGATCALGSRASAVYGRLYDKGVESGKAPARTIWRWEVEVKGELASLTALELAAVESLEAEAASIVQGRFSQWGCRPPLRLPDKTSVQPRLLIRDPDYLTSLAWLHAAVRPTIERLTRAGMLPEVFQALGLDPPTGQHPLRALS